MEAEEERRAMNMSEVAESLTGTEPVPLVAGLRGNGAGKRQRVWEAAWLEYEDAKMGGLE